MVGIGLAVLALTLGFQEDPDISVGIRPRDVRLGDRMVLTVQVRSGTGLPEAVEWTPPGGILLEDVKDRTSAGIGGQGTREWVLEREFLLLAEAPGKYELPPIRITLGGVTHEKGAPSISVSRSPLSWPQAPESGHAGGKRSTRRDPYSILPEDTPPLTGEMSEAYEGVPGNYGQWWGYPPYASHFPWGFPGPGAYWPYGFPSLYGPTLYGGSPYGSMPLGPTPWNPTPWSSGPQGPGGGWTLPPPGPAPGLPDSAVGPWPYGGGQPFPSYPGQTPYAGGQGIPPTTGASPAPGWQGNLGVPGQVPSTQGGWGHTLPPIPGGQWPEGMGGGWAETATGDPWWPEIVPELYEFSTWTETPDGAASLGAALTPPRVFVGQQVTYVATAAMQPGAFLGLGADPEYLPPSPRGFWTVDLPDPIVAKPSASQGGVAQSYTFRRALFPLRSGEYRIPPGRVLLPTASPRPPAAVGWDTLSADPLGLSVLSVPEAPDLPGYAGAVGRYRLEAGVTPRRLAVGETAVLVVRILGVGNIEMVPPPEIPPIYGGEMAPGGDFAAVEVREGVVGGVRTFTWLVVPLEPGPIRIGPLVFSYFDPYVGDFGQVFSEELELEVTELPGGE